MNLYILALVAAMSFGSAWKVQDWRHDSQQLTVTKTVIVKEKAQAAAVDTAADRHEKDKVQIRTVTKTITREVERIVREPFYVDAPACFDDAGLRQLAVAAAGRAPVASEPPPAVRGAKPSR